MKENGFDGEKIKHYFSGEFEEKDENYINDIFCDNSKEKELKKVLSDQFVEILSEDNGVKKKDLDHILFKIHYDINSQHEEAESRKYKKLLMWAARIAGIIIFPIAVFWGIKGYVSFNSYKQTWIEINAPAWTRAQFNLPDGTTGWLNSNSSIKYRLNFNEDRQISLNGEAFLDVKEDKRNPFTVNTDNVVVKVLGTRFNIASYENEKNVEVVLLEGKLELNDVGMKHSFVMNPNDMIIYDKLNQKLTSEVVEPNKYMAWTEGKLVFRNDPIDVIARRLERWYNIDVEINGDITEDLRLRATFIDDGLEGVLDLLKRSLPINCSIKPQEIDRDGTYTKRKVIITQRIIKNRL